LDAISASRKAARRHTRRRSRSSPEELGTLDRVRQVVKVFGMVNCAPGFNRTPEVIDGCSDLLVAVFGEAGRHTRAAVGMAELPFDIPVEIEMVCEVE
jgi:enamine deaminase RidA (YjgF/YER057c/UK114 family)